jgi:hypothetical protein
MKSKFRSMSLAFIVVFSLGVSVVAAASAHEFVASKTGKLTVAISTPVEFNLAETVVNAKCEGHTLPTGSGTVTALKSKALIVKVKYPDCHVPGFFLEYVPFTEEYEVSAEGTWKPLHTVLVEGKFGEEPVSCKWNSIPTKTEESVATYTNSAPVSTVKGVRASKKMKEELVFGSQCGESDEIGSWKETATFGVEGGTLQWK